MPPKPAEGRNPPVLAKPPLRAGEKALKGLRVAEKPAVRGLKAPNGEREPEPKFLLP